MRTKRKTVSHIIERDAISIIQATLPNYWTLREYQPDYGIDLEVELFEMKEDSNRRVYDTLGEHIYIQVKGKESIEVSKYTIKNHNNEKLKDIDVIRHQIETTELYTIERMSSAIPVLLFLVDTTSKEIYFLCLNDYIEKVIIHEDPNYYEKESKTIYIPMKNRITDSRIGINPIMFYAKRPKLYSFFNKVNSQNIDFSHTSDNDLVDLAKRFTKALLRFDVWGIKKHWLIMENMYRYLINIINVGEPKSIKYMYEIDNKEELWETNYSDGELYSKKQVVLFMEFRSLWEQLNNLYDIYEVYTREWFLPTYLGDNI